MIHKQVTFSLSIPFSLNRKLYILGVLFMTLSMLYSMFHAFNYFQIGNAVYEHPHIIKWHLLGFALDVPVFIVLFYYFRHKDYNHAFSVLIVLAVTVLIFHITGYTWLQGRVWGMQDKVSFMLLLGVLTIYGFVLIYSNASERPYLKKIGYFISVFTPIVATMYVLIITNNDTWLQETLNYAFRWAELIGSIIPILYIFNFLRELKQTPPQENMNEPFSINT